MHNINQYQMCLPSVYTFDGAWVEAFLPKMESKTSNLRWALRWELDELYRCSPLSCSKISKAILVNAVHGSEFLVKYSLLHPKIHGSAICPNLQFNSPPKSQTFCWGGKKTTRKISTLTQLPSPPFPIQQVCMMAFSPTEYTTELNGDVPWVFVKTKEGTMDFQTFLPWGKWKMQDSCSWVFLCFSKWRTKNK